MLVKPWVAVPARGQAQRADGDDSVLHVAAPRFDRRRDGAGLLIRPAPTVKTKTQLNARCAVTDKANRADKIRTLPVFVDTANDRRPTIGKKSKLPFDVYSRSMGARRWHSSLTAEALANDAYQFCSQSQDRELVASTMGDDHTLNCQQRYAALLRRTC